MTLNKLGILVVAYNAESTIESTLNLIKSQTGTEININNLDTNDKLTYKLFQKGQTTGVFQFESQGMKKALIGLKPSEFNDLIAMVSLYRPGPMELIPTYIARKHKKEEVSYLHPNLEAILKPTYGIMIYQEQLMQASQAVAGFSLPEADTLRKAVGKKIKELMEEQKINIIEGTVKQGISRETARDVLPLATETTMYMKGSVRSWIHYLDLRCSQDTQLEHRYIAEDIKLIFVNNLPNISEALGWKNSYGT
jgi:DNA polymerase-3 subunit alpha